MAVADPEALVLWQLIAHLPVGFVVTHAMFTVVRRSIYNPAGFNSLGVSTLTLGMRVQITALASLTWPMLVRWG